MGEYIRYSLNLACFIFCSIYTSLGATTFGMLSKIAQHTHLKYLVSMFEQV